MSSKLYAALFGMLAFVGSLAGQTVAVPIHEYLLNENPITAGGTAHDSAQSLNGTYTGNVLSATGFGGVPNNAAHFDGFNSSVQLSGLSPLNVNIGTLGLSTITAWIKVDAGFDQDDRIIYNESDADDACCGDRPGVLLWLTNVNGVGGVLEYGIHQGCCWSFADVTNAPPLDPTRWYLVAAVLSAASGQSAYIFDDTGTLIGSANVPNFDPTDAPTNLATIGAWTGSTCGCQTTQFTANLPFLGSLQDVSFYNTDLTATQLASFPLPNTIPAAVTVFSPAQGATSVAVTPTLTWSPASGASSYDVYIGTSPTPPFAGNTAANNFTIELNPSTTYYWYLVSKNPSASTRSALWSFTTQAGPPPHPAFFLGEVPLGGGVYYLQFQDKNIFGYYNYVSSAIFYHYDMGYEAFVPGPALDIYLYDFSSTHWLYTSTTLFPYLYDFNLKAWIFYFANTQSAGHYSTNPRYFSNLTTGKIFTM